MFLRDIRSIDFWEVTGYPARVPFTKAEVYSKLINVGAVAGFFVVPEYRIKASLEVSKREIDIAWCIENPHGESGRPWLPVGVFEIEGHDVELRRNGTFRGIEKDADSILTAAKYLYAHTGLNLAPAAAVVLFQLAADGKPHNSPMVVQVIEGHRQRFENHAKHLCKLNVERLPAQATALGRHDVLLDDALELHLEQLVKRAQSIRDAIQSLTRVARI